MKSTLSVAIAAGVLVAGCGRGGEEIELPPPTPVAMGVDSTESSGGQVSQNPMDFLPKPAETLIDINTVERPTSEDGKVMDDLAYLNHIVFNVNEGRATYVSDITPDFKNDAERAAYEAALAKSREPVKELEELVRIKVIKALPAAPAGKRYAISPANGKVELVNQ